MHDAWQLHPYVGRTNRCRRYFLTGRALVEFNVCIFYACTFYACTFYACIFDVRWTERKLNLRTYYHFTSFWDNSRNTAERLTLIPIQWQNRAYVTRFIYVSKCVTLSPNPLYMYIPSVYLPTENRRIPYHLGQKNIKVTAFE